MKVSEWKAKSTNISELRASGVHKGQRALVLGSGPSARSSWLQVKREVTIGVNTVSIIQPVDYLLLADHPDSFRAKGTLEDILNGMHREFVFMEPQCGNWYDIPDVQGDERVWYAYGYATKGEAIDRDRGRSFGKAHGGWIPAFNGATFAAAGFAAYIGCSEVVLGGVDYSGGHNWGHASKIKRVNQAYFHLAEWMMEEHGCKLLNASHESKLVSIEKV